MEEGVQPAGDGGAPRIGPELRIGMVLYGGVSLVIYMYGVVHEVWRLARASRAIEAGVDEVERERRTNPWVDVLAAANVDVRVDLISGASAGGLNGILLAKALVEEANLEVAESIWLDVADIEKLTHSSSDKAPASLLRSELLRKALHDGLGEMAGAGGRTAPDSDRAGLSDVFDLFISTTHLEGHLQSYWDDLGTELPTMRHRVPVNLRYRSREAYERALRASVPPAVSDRDDFTDDELLTRLGAATSAFPVAFEPVAVDPARSASLKAEGIDWPAGVYSDGGIVDNKPFTEVLATTFARAADYSVSRWLISVDPDMRPPKRAVADPPDFMDVAGAAMVGIPRYESIAEDLERLQRHNAEAQALWEQSRELEAALAILDAGTDPRVLLPQFLYLAEMAEWGYERPPGGPYGEERFAALVSFLERERLRVLAPRDVEAARPRVASEIEELLEQRGIRGPVDWEGTVEFDVAYELRRAYYVVRLLDWARAEDREAAIEARAAMWRRIEELRHATWEATQRSLDVEPLLEAVEGGRAAELSAPEVVQLPNGIDVSPAEAWDRYVRRDPRMLRLGYAGYLSGHGRVRHAQISAVSARAITDDPGRKLAGDTAAHFGGFLSRPWRENDMLWGRLDAAEILARVLAEETGRPAAAWVDDAQSSIAAEAGCEGDDWRNRVLARSLGQESLLDLGPWKVAGLALRLTTTMQSMLASVAADPGAGARGVIKGTVAVALAKLLGFVLVLLRPFTWASEHGLPQQIAVGAAGLSFLWGAVTLVLSAFLDGIDTGEVVIPCLIAMAPLLLAAAWLWAFQRAGRRRRRKAADSS